MNIYKNMIKIFKDFLTIKGYFYLVEIKNISECNFSCLILRYRIKTNIRLIL